MHTGDKPELKNDKIRVCRKDKNFECTIREKIFPLHQHVEPHHKIHLKDVSLCNTFHGEIIQSGRQDCISPGHSDCDKYSNLTLSLAIGIQNNTRQNATASPANVIFVVNYKKQNHLVLDIFVVFVTQSSVLQVSLRIIWLTIRMYRQLVSRAD